MQETLDPWGRANIESYENLFKEFGIQPFEKFRKKFTENRYIRRGIIFGHRDFDKIANSIDQKKKFVMMTGLMPSGKFHLGHKMVAEQIVWYQNLGAKVYLCAADLESYLMRNISFEKAKEIAVEEYLKNYVALGLTEKNLTFWFQSDYKVPYYRLRDVFSKRVTFNELNAIYGSLEPRKIFSSLTQVADILHMQLPEFEGPLPSVVPVGADQDPHIRLTRDIAARLSEEYKFVPPSSTYHKFMQGLQGGKMSSSDPSSYIALTDKPEDAVKKIMRTKTGGRATIQEQKEKGGIPEECVVYELFVYHLVESDEKLKEIYKECKAGKLMCGDCKKNCAEIMKKFLTEHQKKLNSPDTEKIVKKILSNK